MALHLVKPERQRFEESIGNIPDLMNACLFYGPCDIRNEKIPTPKISKDEILVKIKTALTCGTDLKTYERGHPKLIRSVPSTFGHQFSGVVAKVGENVRDFYIGQKVVALNSAPCFKCTFCTREQFSLCENIGFLNGAYAEYIAIPPRIVEHNTYEIPEGVSFESAASLEGLSVVLHGLEKSCVSPGKTVCVIGCGSIGLMFVALAKLHGAKVISIGRKDFKLKIAKELGADFTLNVSNMNHDMIQDKLRSSISKEGPEIVIEAVGLPETWELATKIVSRGGIVNFFGGCKKGTKVELDTYRLHYDELKLIGVFHHTPKHVRTALGLLGPLQEKIFSKIITHALPLCELDSAFLLHQSGDAIQVAIHS